LKKSAFLTNFSIVVIAIYFFSGACSLIYEVLWQRLLKLILGNTTYATSITVAVFMGGLALGSLLVRKKADAIGNKLRAYGIIELTVTIFAFLTPILLKVVDHFYTVIFQSFAPAPAVMLFLQVLLSSIILAVPTVLMGCTLPLLASLLVRTTESIGHETGILYSINTLGALAGAGITGFFGIRHFGVFPTYYIAVGLNGCIAAASLLFSMVYKNAPDKIASYSKSNDPGPGLRFAVFCGLFISGFVALGYEILWNRTIVHLLGAEIYTFSAVLCVYLAGYASGVFVGGKLARKGAGSLGFFCIFAQIVGLCGIFYFPIAANILDIDILWRSSLIQWLGANVGYFAHMYICMLLFFPPSFCMGVCFPLLVQAERKDGVHSGHTVSKAFGYNTLGCVLGSLATGFLFIPLFGSQVSMYLLGLLALFSGFAALFFVKNTLLRTIGVCLLATGIGAVLFQPKDLFSQWVNKTEGGNGVQLIDIMEGVTTTASVHYYEHTDSKVISTAGINVAGDAIDLRQTQKIQAHLPVILHGNARSVLTVGFGSGELTKTLTFHNIPDITCVEISPEMVALAKKHFSSINLGAELEKHVTMIYMDAKNYLHLTKKKFDVIENDCIWPGAFAESSSLYTKEYFLDGKRRLNDNGVYATWLPLAVPQSTLLSIIKTFTGVFENTLFIYPHFVPGKHILLIGQKSAHPYHFLSAKREFEKPEVKQSLSLLGIGDIYELLGNIAAYDSSLCDIAKDASVNSDYFPFIEFDMNRLHSTGDPAISWKNLDAIVSGARPIDFNRLLSFDGVDSTERSRALERLLRDGQANGYLLKSFIAPTPEEKLRIIGNGLLLYPNNQDLLRMRQVFSLH
jgi:spermidine synthase